MDRLSTWNNKMYYILGDIQKYKYSIFTLTLQNNFSWKKLMVYV